MLKLTVFVLSTHLEVVKSAIFAAGAGRQGDYDRCCWQTTGTGEFRPLGGSNAYVGRKGEVAQIPEIMLVSLVPRPAVEDVLAALHDAHPYETPTYYLCPVATSWHEVASLDG